MVSVADDLAQTGDDPPRVDHVQSTNQCLRVMWPLLQVPLMLIIEDHAQDVQLELLGSRTHLEGATLSFVVVLGHPNNQILLSFALL